MQKLAWEMNQKKKAKQAGEEGAVVESKSESKPEEAGPSHTHGSALSPSPVAEQSNTALAPATQPSKRDKVEGKAVVPSNASTESTTASVAGPSSASAPNSAPNIDGPSNSTNATNEARTADTTTPTEIAGSSPLSSLPSTSTNDGPSNATIDASKDVKSVTATADGERTNPPTNTTTAVTNEETNQETTANDADKSTTIHVRTGPVKIKLKTAADKKDIKGKDKAVDYPTAPNKNSHKVTKPSGSEHPAAVAERKTIRRALVFKGNYWVFKLDSSMFTQKDAIRKEFLTGKGKGKTTAMVAASASVNDNDDTNGDDNGGEGSSKPTAITTSAVSTNSPQDNSHTEGDNIADDELALNSNGDNSDNKNPKTATTAVASASSSSSSSNKRKRAADDTGKEFETGYYVLRCPLDGNCMTESNTTHNGPAGRAKGIFCRHPFKRRRAMNHIKA